MEEDRKGKSGRPKTKQLNKDEEIRQLKHKIKYQEQKKEQDAKAKQTVIEVKEIKLRPGTDEGDYQVKMRNIRRFLDEGDKVKVTLRFRGREMAHQELGMEQLVIALEI